MPRARVRPSAGAPTLRRNVADLRALAHPLRLRMLELFAETPRTTKQVAELLGQPPTRLYHHVAALERAGLLVLKEKRQNRGAVEKWYSAVGQEIRREGEEESSVAGRRAARRAVAATVLEQAKQEIMAIPAGAREAALITRMLVVASASEIPTIRKRLFEQLQALREEFQIEESNHASSTDDCERWAVTLAFAPVVSPRRRSAKTPADAR